MREIELIHAAQRGDLLAFNRLVLEHQETVYNIFYRVLCVETAAEEATQATFLRAYQDLHRYHNGSFRTWLLQKAIQICRQKLHANGHASQQFLEQSQGGEDQTILTHLSTLAPEDRLVLVLVDIHGLEYCDAAAALQISPNAIQSQLALARQQILDRMAPFHSV